ncbi:hypothetical protein SAY86_002988 [Trapa natans]|uniref:Uncharacterized protein n=1 Tax=Trapa natans TaxID=22666 RepID=A0AAN7LL56_TRANT|nr:hypothetical protein SAY86_002988 [Trapa natans]
MDRFMAPSIHVLYNVSERQRRGHCATLPRSFSQKSSYSNKAHLPRSYSLKNASTPSSSCYTSSGNVGGGTACSNPNSSSSLFRSSSVRASSSTSKWSSLARSSSQKSSGSNVTRKYSSLAKEQKARFYIMRRCIAMLVCWHKHGEP